jgi:hypothetical protein
MTELVPSPPAPVFQVSLFTPTPKAAKHVLEFFECRAHLRRMVRRAASDSPTLGDPPHPRS